MIAAVALLVIFSLSVTAKRRPGHRPRRESVLVVGGREYPERGVLAAAVVEDLTPPVTTRSSRRKPRCSSRSWALRPAALPSSTSSWRAKLRGTAAWSQAHAR